MGSPTGKQLLQRDASLLICAQLGASIVLSSDTESHYSVTRRNLDGLSTKTKADLRATIERISAHVKRLRQKHGIVGTDRELAEIARNCLLNPEGAWFIPLEYVERIWPRFSIELRKRELFLPRHARIELGVGRRSTSPHGPSWSTPEAILYSELGALANLLVRDFEEVTWNDRERHRAHKALTRSVIATAAYFVEAYLNGIAADHLLTQGTALDEDSRLCMQGRDPKKPARLLSTKDKILKYQLLITGTQSVQENIAQSSHIFCES